MEWISVNNRLPKEDQEVIVVNEDGEVAKGWCDDGWWDSWDDTFTKYKKVIYWFPIPELPESLRIED